MPGKQNFLVGQPTKNRLYVDTKRNKGGKILTVGKTPGEYYSLYSNQLRVLCVASKQQQPITRVILVVELVTREFNGYMHCHPSQLIRGMVGLAPTMLAFSTLSLIIIFLDDTCSSGSGGGSADTDMTKLSE